MRLFIAIDLPRDIKKSLSVQLEDFKKKNQDFTWVDEINYHITLLFLGETVDVKRVKEKIKMAIYDQFHFHLYSYKTDLFIKNKITIYLGFRREKKLENLVTELKKSLGLPDPLRYIPHLTLARYRIPSKQQYFVLKKWLSKQNIEIEFPVKKIYLFESIISGSHPIYKKLATFSLL